MVLVSFSEPAHVPLLQDGSKTQTTRLERKYPIVKGDLLQCYYKARATKTCLNCITPDCKHSVAGKSALVPADKCLKHSNFFGVANVTSVITLKEALQNKEEFARKDGFESWEDANLWFSKTSRVGDKWVDLPYVVIKFDPFWLEKGGDFSE